MKSCRIEKHANLNVNNNICSYLEHKGDATVLPGKLK